MPTLRPDGYISPTIAARLHMSAKGCMALYHPQAQSEFAREQGYVVAHIDDFYRSTYGRLFEQAPKLLARALDRLTAMREDDERDPLIADIRAALGLPQESHERANHESHEPGCDLFVGRRQCSCSPYSNPSEVKSTNETACKDESDEEPNTP